MYLCKLMLEIVMDTYCLRTVWPVEGTHKKKQTQHRFPVYAKAKSNLNLLYVVLISIF